MNYSKRHTPSDKVSCDGGVTNAHFFSALRSINLISQRIAAGLQKVSE